MTQADGVHLFMFMCMCVYLRTRVVKTHSTAVNDLYDHQEDLTYLLLFKFICFVCIFSYGCVITCLISYIIKVKVLEGVITVKVKNRHKKKCEQSKCILQIKQTVMLFVCFSLWSNFSPPFSAELFKLSYTEGYLRSC